MPPPIRPSLDPDDIHEHHEISTARRRFFSGALSFRSRSRHSSPQRTDSAPAQISKGTYGLNRQYVPASFDHRCHGNDTDAHVVFVHGLAGDSEHTWSKGGILWPRDLLPAQDAFTNVAVYTFGYDSNFRKSNMLGIHDFAKSLLCNIQDDPIILSSKSPIILIGHSMGGLVIQMAYILARRSPEFEELADRIKAMFFLSTPHHGSDHAEILSALFRLAPGPRPYLEELKSGSNVIKSILADFTHYVDELHLQSFYETKPLHISGIGRLQVVDKHNAVLGYEKRSQLLNGDHRSICKFDSAEDSNFKIIHQALARTISIIRDQVEESHEYGVSRHREKLSQYLGIREPPEDDLFRVAAERVPDTCAWIEEKAAYHAWSNGSRRKMLWVRGPPASGKSFVSGSIVERLKNDGANVCYYFLVFGNASKAMISTLLLSIAWQAASYDPAIERKVIEVCAKDPRLTQSGDYRTIWRKLWLEAILSPRSNAKKPMFLVVDALDECRLENDLVRLLVKLTETGFAKVMVTSRNEPDYYHIKGEAVILLNIDMADTQRDISIYLDQRRNIIDEEIREVILQRSNGCFLWAFLVVERLSNCADSSARLRLVKEEPIGMDELYSRVLQSISNREDVEQILTWVACATRPLSLQEMAFAMKLQPTDIGEIIRRNCYDLIFLDSRDRICIRHSSAREFLLRSYLKDVKGAHGRVALACLDYLTGPEMKNKQRRRMSITSPTRSPFVSYACSSLCEHLNLASSQNKKILISMAGFFSSSNVLAWIEYLSQQKRLEVILATAQALRDFIRRKSKTDLLLGNEIMVVDEWADDLVKLVSKFGRQLLTHPESIFALIPPFCPPESAPYKLYKQIPPGLNAVSVCGISSTTWDDCLCTISIPTNSRNSAPVSSLSMDSEPTSQRPERMNSFATSDSMFCIGTSHGRAIVYNDKTFLPSNIVTLNTRLPLQILLFATTKPVLAIANNRCIQIWNTTKWEKEWETPIGKQCVAMTFIDQDQLLLAACKNNTLLVMNLIDRKLEKVVKWMDKFVEKCGNRVRGKIPMVASFHPEMDLLAIAYRSMDIIVWNFEEDTYSIYNHDNGLSNVLTEPFTAVWDMTFSRLPGTCLLVASYNTGSLVLFDVMNESVKVTISDPGAFGRLTSSPDGRTLAAAANDGTIVLFDFETLRKLYKIKTEEPGITVLSFTGDNTRLLDIRGGGQNCRVWDPVALYRREPVDEGSDRTSSIYSGESEFSVLDRNETLPMVTAVVCDASGDFFFVGKDDSTVSAYSTKSGFEVAALFSHGASIMRLQYDPSNSRLTSVDTAGCLMIHVISQKDEQWQATRLFTHQATGTGVQNFVCDTGARVLICANDVAELYTFDNPSIPLVSKDCSSRIHCHWARHPSDPESLLLISEGLAYIYNWSKLEKLAPDDGILLTGSLLPDIVVCNAFSFFDGALFGIACLRAESRSKHRLLCYNSSHIYKDSTSAPQTVECQRLCENIQHIIGEVHGKLIFLHSNGWVCSVRKDGFVESRSVLFHFMPPADWLGASAEYVIAVSQLGDVFFAWKGEVAVVKRGLERSFEL